MHSFEKNINHPQARIPILLKQELANPPPSPFFGSLKPKFLFTRSHMPSTAEVASPHPFFARRSIFTATKEPCNPTEGGIVRFPKLGLELYIPDGAPFNRLTDLHPKAERGGCKLSQDPHKQDEGEIT